MKAKIIFVGSLVLTAAAVAGTVKWLTSPSSKYKGTNGGRIINIAGQKGLVNKTNVDAVSKAAVDGINSMAKVQTETISAMKKASVKAARGVTQAATKAKVLDDAALKKLAVTSSKKATASANKAKTKVNKVATAQKKAVRSTASKVKKNL